MKITYLFLLVLLVACNNGNSETETENNTDTRQVDSAGNPDAAINKTPLPVGKVYSNARFKEVTVEKIGEHQFRIQGKGQIFEASFSWVVEDGHNELKSGYQMTDAGAPEWGHFSFTIEVEKQRENSTLTLILFESSPKDGSRQHELPIVLD
jgi:hypothetical protein